MPKEIRVYSMAVLDLLTCALGGTILVSFLLIVSMGQRPPAGLRHAHFTIMAGVWIDVTNRAEDLLSPPVLEKLLAPDGKPGTDPGELQADELPESERLKLEKIKGIDCNVELRLFYRDPEESAATDAIIRFNEEERAAILKVDPSLKRAVELVDQPGEFISNVTPVGLRRVVTKRGHRLFCAFLVHAAGFGIRPGWYFARLAIVKQPSPIRRPDLADLSAGWIRIESGGRPSALLCQTHAEFDPNDSLWPTAASFPWLYEQFELTSDFLGEPGAKDREQMDARRLPDVYLPGWPERYPPRAPADREARIVPKGDAPQFRLVDRRADGGRNPWPYFALVVEANQASPDAARFPDHRPGRGKGPGWYGDPTATPKSPPRPDEYLPGFLIQEASHP